MPRLPHPCFIVMCLAGSLLQLPFFCADEHPSDYEYNPTPPTDYDYNATFEYNFYSNSSYDDIESFLKERESEYQEENLDVDQPTVDPTTLSKNREKTSSSKTSRMVYPSFLLVLVLAAHQLLRIL